MFIAPVLARLDFETTQGRVVAAATVERVFNELVAGTISDGDRGDCELDELLIELEKAERLLAEEVVDLPDPWATNEWQRTLVTPLFVGGPAHGKTDEPRQRHALPLRIEMPAMRAAVEAFLDDHPDDPHIEEHFAFDSYVYRLGPYHDAFTVEYR